MKKTAPAISHYGSWKSPIGAAMVAEGSLGLEQISLSGREVFWIEKRPEEGGRQVIVRLGEEGLPRDVTPAPLSARTRIHEYGGQSYVLAGGIVVFSNLADGRLYAQEPGATPRPITPQGPYRYGDLTVSPDGSQIICVREDYGSSNGTSGADGTSEPVDAIVSIPIGKDSSLPLVAQNDTTCGAQGDGNSKVRVLVLGSDFYGSPRLSPDGRSLAWLAWNHPNMPWDGTELWLGDVASHGDVVNRRLAAGGPEESVFQPEWSPDGDLYFVSDRSGWWNLYRLHTGRVEALHPMDAEFGMPGWVLGLRTYDFAGPGQIACAYCERSSWHLALLDTTSLAFEPIPLPFTHISGVWAEAESVLFIARSPADNTQLVRLNLSSRSLDVLRQSSLQPLEPGFVASPQPIEFPTERGLTAHAFYYPPRNREHAGPPGERPPLLVVAHGGPTDAVSPSLSLSTQFWTSRGFAVVQVNYGGSTGYGRAYRERLNGQWGIVDVEDCVNAARALAAQGLVDRDRMVIRGGSAGGYTALRALALHDLFRAGAIYYGVSDLEMLVQDTSKFESRYTLRLVGPYPEARDLYRERSPIHSAGKSSAGLIFFQGLDDTVVLPRQTEGMVEAARRNGAPVASLMFEGEGHGFRRAETTRRALEAELYFYSRIFGFELEESIEPIPIENL